MYVVIETGGKQYSPVRVGGFLQIEKLKGKDGGPLEKGDSVQFNEVLFWSQPGPEDSIILAGKPYLPGAQVHAEIVGQGRGKKILIVKMKRRKQYRKTQGHKQEYTQVLITKIQNGAGESIELSEEEKKLKLAQFQSHLKPKGLAFTPRMLGSKKKRAQKVALKS